jgi:hypothetical protein
MQAEVTLGTNMDALLLRSLQGYVRNTFGVVVWQTVCRRARLAVESFEPLLSYDEGLADQVAQAAAEVLGRPVDAVWQDVGTHLVINPDHEGVRRLLRFGGVGFVDFLYSLEELPGRSHLALPGIALPALELHEIGPDRFEVRCQSHVAGLSQILVGVLTAMADDYGTLCVIEEGHHSSGERRILVEVMDSFHSAARPFDLALPEAKR